MYKFWRTANIVILCLLIFICGLGVFYKHISFGMGFGDILGYIILFIGTFTQLFLTIKFFKRSLTHHIIMTLSFLFYAMMIVLFATIARGNEYKWNGKLFYDNNLTETQLKNASPLLLTVDLLIC